MSEGHGQDQWSRTSLVCAVIANANRDPKKHRPFKTSDFDPYRKTTRQSQSIGNQYGADDLQLLREALTGKKGKRHDP
jgi:hypothetical protein